jgi:FkbM family methyltransferase
MSIKRRIVGQINQIAFVDKHVYTAKHGPARGLKRQGGLGWLPSIVPRWHEGDAEEAFLMRLNWQGATVFDIGGDQGLFTLFFAQQVGSQGQVIVFEPNPRSRQRIERNVELNGFQNVRIIPRGVGEEPAVLQFIFPEGEPACGSAALPIADLIGKGTHVSRCEISVNSLDEEIKQSDLPLPDFIKLDVEGMEHSALKGMRETLRNRHPRLSIEIHGADMNDKITNVQRVVAFLEELNYRMLHIESSTTITEKNAAQAREGHLYCE